ncbi:MAG: endolytic transglycosylase MltG [Candidatus Colwellbacteria bacterium]|nr:endolytic transglycosylase MltG [Candidatus Colwellbacteria bacterium]
MATIVLLLLLDFGVRGPSLAAVKSVLIREGMTAQEINDLLITEDVLREGEVIPSSSEGYLLPDTYEFYLFSTAEVVLARFKENFDKKAAPLLAESNEYETLILASLLEKEVITLEDKRLVAGILLERLRRNEALHVDATICYVKPLPCHPILKKDFEIDSLYNTYMYKGLPPTPIANPGIESITASSDPLESNFLFYITHPETKRAIFATTLDEHNVNVFKYLK